MRAERKNSLMIGGGVATLIVIAVIVAALRFDVNSYKSKIETASSELIGMDFKINGGMRLSFFPFGISAKDVRVANRGSDLYRKTKRIVQAGKCEAFYNGSVQQPR